MSSNVGAPFLMDDDRSQGEITIVVVDSEGEEPLDYQVWADNGEVRASFGLSLWGRVTYPHYLEGRTCHVVVNSTGGPDAGKSELSGVGHVKVREKGDHVDAQLELPPRCATELVLFRQFMKPGADLRLRFDLRNERRFVDFGGSKYTPDDRMITAEIIRVFAYSHDREPSYDEDD